MNSKKSTKEINNLISLIQKNLTDDLLKPKYRGRKEKYAGHCYVASECFYYLYGKDHGWKPYCFRNSAGETHWWLQKESEIIDITAEQLPPGYDYSRGRLQFFVNYPSKRCKILAEKVRWQQEWSNTFAGAAEVVAKELKTLRDVIFDEAKKNVRKLKWK